jgi:hypothetical protein
MGELNITITDLDHCTVCGATVPMIFEEKKGWWVSCGFRKCTHRTKVHKELLDAADQWGLKSEDAST